MSIRNTGAALPIGSIVMLDGIHKLICIIGKNVKNKENGNTYGYVGVYFPVGFEGPDKFIMFNEPNIDKVYSFGLLDTLEGREPGEANADNFQGILPVGTVVRLQEGNLYLMIMGVGIENTEVNHLFDYIAVPFPEGLGNAGKMYTFDKEQIEEVLHLGFIYDGQLDFEKYMEKVLSEKDT